MISGYVLKVEPIESGEREEWRGVEMGGESRGGEGRRKEEEGEEERGGEGRLRQERGDICLSVLSGP